MQSETRRRGPFFGELPTLFWPSLATGLAGSLVGVVYLFALHQLQRLLGPQAWSPSAHVLLMAGAGAAVALIVRFVGPTGDVELLVDNIHLDGGERNLRHLESLIPASLLCIASGGALGPEAPLVQTTGTLGTWLSDRWGIPREDTRVLTISGMAAGFTVLFGAPIGAAVFSLEILHRRGLEYHEALMPAILSSLVGYSVYAAVTGLGLQPVWTFPDAGALKGVDMLWGVAAGFVGAGVAGAFTYFNMGLRRVFRALPPDMRPVAGGAALGALALLSPYALTFGERQVMDVMAAPAAAALLFAAAAAKFAGTSVTLSSGWRGGFIIPLFFMGVALGRLGHVWWPRTNEVVLVAALMAAASTGVTKTPVGSTLVVTGMAGIRLVPTTLAAAVTSLLLTSEVALIHTQRARYSASQP